MNKNTPIFQSLEIIENRITEKLSVENLARSVHFSKFHYQRLFREIVGGSVMEYVTKRKMTLAGKELLETNKAVTDIAIKYGYDSREGFARSFKAYMGVTPGEYRKYNLSSISQNKLKERCIMMYSQTTDQVIRELNDFIATAKDTANLARKSRTEHYNPFWELVAGMTDSYADSAKNTLSKITAIAEHPDEITNKFTVIKVMEDVSFNFNLLAFNVGLMISRASPDQLPGLEPLKEKYRELAFASSIKLSRIVQLFNELTQLIFDDMRKTVEEKMQKVVEEGTNAADKIKGYKYIKDEVENVAVGLQNTHLDSLTAGMIESYLFRLNIINFSVQMDVFRNPVDKPMFDGIAGFIKVLFELKSYMETLTKMDITDTSEPLYPDKKVFEHITFQMNILLFYTRGEASYEKLGNFINENQKKALSDICDNMNGIIQIANTAKSKNDFIDVTEKINKLVQDMENAADDLGLHGAPISFITTEVKTLAERIYNWLNKK